MAGQYPSMGYVADSQTVLLRKICNNTAQIVDTGGGGGGAVTQLIAGSNITLSPPTGLGAVTISASGGGGGGGNAFGSSTNSTGNTTLTPTQPNYTYLLTFSGSAGNRIIILATAGRTAGDKIFLDLVLPATAAIVISVRNATSGGTLLLPAETFDVSQNFTTDGNIRSAHWEFTYNGTAWVYDMSNMPA